MVAGGGLVPGRGHTRTESLPPDPRGKAGRLLCVQFAADLEGRLRVPREGGVWLTCRGGTVGGR